VITQAGHGRDRIPAFEMPQPHSRVHGTPVFGPICFLLDRSFYGAWLIALSAAVAAARNNAVARSALPAPVRCMRNPTGSHQPNFAWMY
jgi:hypothetical protein